MATAPTPTQLKYQAAVETYGGVVAASRALGVDHGAISRSLKSLRKKTDPDSHRMPDEGKRIMVIPDVQAKPGNDFSFLMREGTYAVEKKPDIIVCIGDFADLPSLSSYDKGKKSFEGRRYKRDCEAAHWAMSAFMTPIVEYNERNPKRPYKPRLVLTLGNHEERILRAVNDDPKLDGVMSVDDLKYKDFGWEVYPFLEVVVIEGIAFSHYFTSGQMGRPAASAQAQLRRTNMSCVAGHQQGKQIAYGYRADGSTITSIICGSNYEHTEDYLGPQGNRHYRGFLMLHEAKDGAFDEMWVSINYINRRYPHIKAPEPVYSMPTAQELQAGHV